MKPMFMQFFTQSGRIGEEDAVHAESVGGLYVRFQVVDVDGIGRIDGEGLKEKLIETRDRVS